jgi:hypothetical protein
MKLMRFSSKENKPLLAMLDSLFAERGFTLVPFSAEDRPDIALWTKSVGAALRVKISITLNPGLSPNIWSLEPQIQLDSSYVGYWYNTLRLHRDFCTVLPSYTDTEYLQVLRFLPAHIRWQERPDLEVAVLRGHPETLDSLRGEFTDVYENYIKPMLDLLTTPLAVAEFQLRAGKEFRTTRQPHEEARYQVSTPYISTALLFDEAGETARAIAYLQPVREEFARVWEIRDPRAKTRVCGQMDRLLDHLRSKLNASTSTS